MFRRKDKTQFHLETVISDRFRNVLNVNVVTVAGQWPYPVGSI
jgi:hypothetical protein